MKGQLLIDGIEAYTSLGICVTKGSYNNLVAFPAMKEPDKNDWPEEDKNSIFLVLHWIRPK